MTLNSSHNKKMLPSGESPTRRSIRKYMRNRMAVVGLGVLIVLILACVFAAQLSQYSPSLQDLRSINQPPSAAHWLGTDGTGRDVWARMLAGGQVSLAVGLFATVISSAIGVALGAVSGYFGGKIDTIIMRIADIVMSFPAIIGIIVLVSVLEPGINNSIIAIGVLQWPALARLVRGNVLSLREADYVQVAICLGASPWRIITRHVLPNTLSVILVASTLAMSTAILTESGLSFLGFGVQPPTPSWGNMLQQARNFTILEQSPWLWLPPGIGIILTVLSINFIGDGLSDALNPRQKS